MKYTFDTTEPTTPSGNAAETKALLHMLCFDEHRDLIDAFAIDCFNDVTGMDDLGTQLFDVQSKATGNTSPKAIGEDLVTLFKNSVSEFAPFFSSYTLFLGGVSSSVLEDAALGEFGFNDLRDSAQKKVRGGLLAACESKRYVDTDRVTDASIDAFLSDVRFVQSKPEEIDYIRPLIRTSAAVMPDRRILQRIFNQIRDSQSKFKNRPGIANKSIDEPQQVWDFSRVLRRRQIELLVVERVINRNFIKDDVPQSFRRYLDNQVPEDEDEMIEDCKNCIALQYFDKNNKDAFWQLFDGIVTAIDNDPGMEIEAVYEKLDAGRRKECSHLNRPALLYFIANVKDGMKR